MLARIIPAGVVAAAIAVVLVIAFGQLGGATSSARTEREVVSSADGVVQSTVTGTGSLEPVTEEDVGFQTSGTLRAVDVKEGEYVHKGQLLATLDSATAGLTLKQARATLAEARTTLTDDRKTLAGEDNGSSSADDTSAAVKDSGAVAEDVSDHVGTVTTAAAPTTTATTLTTTVTAPTTTVTVPARTVTMPATTGTTGTTPTTSAAQSTTSARPTRTTAATSTTSTTSRSADGDTSRSSTTGSSDSGSTTSSSNSGSASDVTAATIDSDKLAIVDDEQTVREDEADVNETRLTAPVSGTITSLESIVPGDSISSGSDTNESDSSSADTGTDGSDATGASSSASDATAGSTSTDATTSSSGSSSSSTFAEIDTLRHLSMSVSFTEADISQLKVGQAATVTLDALSDTELAGKVTAVSSLGTTDDDVVSYDATITLDQYDAQVKPGMSASAAVITKQGHGVTVPSGAVTGTGTLASVTEDAHGKDTTKQVIVGLRGSSRDLIVSGLKSGVELVETETLPSKGSSTDDTSTSAAGAAGGFSGEGFARGGFGGGAAGGFGGGAAAGGGGAR